MKRPLIITVMGVVLVLSSIIQIGLGILVLDKRGDTAFLEDAKVSEGHAMWVAIALLVLGVIALALAIGLFKGSRVVRNFIGLGQLAQIAGGIYGAATLSGDDRPTAIGSVGGAVVVLYMLFGTEKAKAYFSKPGSENQPTFH